MLFQLKIFRYEFIDKHPIVYVDESGFAVDAPRNGGYSTIGERCYVSKDWHARGSVNAIGAITDFKLFNVCLFDTYMNADVFYAWLTQELIPNAPKDSVIVLDNAIFHKRNGRKPKVSDVNLVIILMNFFYMQNYDDLF